MRFVSILRFSLNVLFLRCELAESQKGLGPAAQRNSRMSMKEGGSIFWKHIFLLGGEKYEFLHFPAKSICLLWEAYGIYSGLSNVGF